MPTSHPQRPHALSGATYKAVLKEGERMYITVNEHDGEPFEVFVRLDDPDLYEWVGAVTVLITRLLRAGEALADIAKELQEIYSPLGSHFIPGGGECPSVPARIGLVLAGHCEKAEECING